MTKSEYQKISKLLKPILEQAEFELITENPGMDYEEIKEIIKQAKHNALVNLGIDPQEYYDYENSLKEIGKEKGRKKKKELEDALEGVKNEITSKLPPPVETLNTEAIRALVSDSIKQIPQKPPQIINKIEKVVEKPQIIKEVTIEKEIDRIALEEFAKDIRELQTTYHDTLNEIKVSKDFMAGFDGKVEGRVKDLVSPELNRIARSFQSQIYRVSEDLKKVSPVETDPLSLHLDQTTPQDISNGQPDFLAGLRAGSTNQLSIDNAGNLTTTGDVEADALITTGGASTDFVKGDGSLDSSTYLTEVKHTVGFTIANDSGITTGKVKGFFTAPFAGEITAWNIVADAGTCTIKVWKIASGTAKPTSANSINTSGVALSSGTAVHSTTLTDFTSTTVTAGDIFAFNIEAISGATELSFNLEII